MKRKRLFCLALTLILALGLTACGAASNGTGGPGYGDTGAAAAQEPLMAADYAYDTAAYETAPEEAAQENAAGSDAAGFVSSDTSDDLASKIIYSAYGELETLDFDASVQKVNELVNKYGAFMENSSVTGNDLQSQSYGWYSGRTASFTIRVPKEHYSDLTGALAEVGNVTYLTSDAENVTAQYTDTQAQLDSLNVQEQRLLSLMEQAETVDDMIKLESRLGEIRTETEQLQAQLTNWDRQVGYSTVTLQLNEVQELTPEPEEPDPSYLQQLKTAFLGSVEFLGQAARGLGKVFAAAIPILLPLALIVVVIVLLCRRASKRREKKAAERAAARHQQVLERDEAQKKDE